MNKTKLLSVVKLLIVVFAILNLIALFVFDYKFPDFLNKSKVGSFNDASSASVSDSGYQIKFDTDTLNYDGTTELDLSTGVTVVDANNKNMNIQPFVNITTADTVNEKIITYTADTENGQISATRKLILSNYTYPSITLPENMPKLEESTLNNMLSELLKDETFIVNDGYGNNLASAVNISYTFDVHDPSKVHYVFSFTNQFNDTIVANADIEISSKRPSLVLNTNTVKIPTNSSFQPLNYVESATDIYGNSCYNSIEITGDFNSATPGVYNLTFICTDSYGNQSHPQKLQVIVE